MNTNSIKALFNEIVQKEQPVKRANYTFRLNEKVVKAFKVKCEKNGVKMTHVLEKLIQAVIDE